MLGERGAERCDAFAKARLGERDHVHIAFDHHHAPALARGGRGKVQVVERPSLVKQGRIGRVQIFGLARAEDAPPECDDAPARIADRDHDPAAEPVVRGLIVDLDQQPRLDQQFFVQMAERRFDAGAAVGRKADAEARDGFGGEAPVPEIGARLFARGAAELRDEPVLRRLADIVQRRARLGLARGARIGGGHAHPGLGGELLDRIHEAQPLVIGEEPDRIPMRSATETMVEALVVVDREARRLLVMERAARLVLAPRALHLHMPPDQRGQRDPRSQFVQPLRGEGHCSGLPPDTRGTEGFSPPRAPPLPRRWPCSCRVRCRGAPLLRP